METLHISDDSELSMVAQRALALLTVQKKGTCASVLALTGDLGAGKTAFTKALAQELGIDDEVNSPTFVIMKRYAVEGAQDTFSFDCLVHIDAYRVDDIDEMRPLRFEEILKEQKTLICIEWAENIKELLPQHTVHMSIEITGESSRTITFL